MSVAEGAAVAPTAAGGAGEPAPSTKAAASSAEMRAELMGQLKTLAQSFEAVPEIYKRRAVGAPDVAAELGVAVADWADLRRRREFDLLHVFGGGGLQASTFVPTQQLLPLSAAAEPSGMRAAHHPKAGGRAGKSKAGSSGRTYTSKYRGVHQTFPTKRWEAQFRRNGKPTSLGCFDREEEAARAYDKMMLWCELHNATGVKGGITNFDPSEYEADLQWLQQVTQDELVQILRSDGRRQAAQRMMRQKRDGQGHYGAGSDGSSDRDD